MNEKNFQTLFGKRNTIHGVFELKFINETKRKSLPFNELKEHQEKALLAASSGDGLYHKISDFPIFAGSKVRFTKPKPFDCFFMFKTMAYVVVMVWIPRKKKNVYYVKVQDWIEMRDRADRKSATEEMLMKYTTIFENYLDKHPKI